MPVHKPRTKSTSPTLFKSKNRCHPSAEEAMSIGLIQQYCCTYIKPWLDVILTTVEKGQIRALYTLFIWAKLCQQDEFDQMLCGIYRSGDKSDEIIMVWKIIQRLIRGELNPMEPLMANLLKIRVTKKTYDEKRLNTLIATFTSEFLEHSLCSPSSSHIPDGEMAFIPIEQHDNQEENSAIEEDRIRSASSRPM